MTIVTIYIDNYVGEYEFWFKGKSYEKNGVSTIGFFK